VDIRVGIGQAFVHDTQVAYSSVVLTAIESGWNSSHDYDGGFQLVWPLESLHLIQEEETL
jgi:hypothetical protein